MQRQTAPNDADVTPSYAGHGLTASQFGEDAIADRFSHLTLEVTDLDRSEAWYRDVIGADVLGRELTAEPRPHAVLQMNTGQLLILVLNPEFRTKRRGAIHHGFMVTPVQYKRALERLPKFGFSIGDTRQQFRAMGEYSIDVQDPDGHRFQIQCYGPEAKEMVRSGIDEVDCGPADRYRVGDVRLFKKGNFFVVRLPEGFIAMTRWCSHMNGLVVYQKEHWRFWCPFHSATYDLQGNNIGGMPGLNALRLLDLCFSPDGHVVVRPDRMSERACFVADQACQPAAETNGAHQRRVGGSPMKKRGV
jgi:catechol 2,3-dioxygenase-like lactoylglutathione lyase family enzyme